MDRATLTHARLLVECTQTRQGPHYTGIQRYVRRTLTHAQLLLGTTQALALVAEGGAWRAFDALPSHPLEGRVQATRPAPARTPVFDDCTHLLLADRFWHTQDWAALDHLLAGPARITLVVYDLLSLRRPQWFPAGVGERFGRYLRAVLPRAQRVVCLSHRVRLDLQAWAGEQGLPCPAASVVAPGHVAWEGEAIAPPALPHEWRDGRQPFVLQVGTLEPRKNHALTLAAMQRLWAQGREIGCLFLGQPGWLTADWAAGLRQLPQWGGLLQWLPECGDPQLQWCYEHARAVLYPSAAEGYGLPLAEAAAAGARVIATDTAVHREVAAGLGGSARIEWCHAEVASLAAALTRVLQEPLPSQPRRHAPARDWQQATRELIEAMGLEGESLLFS
jgi:glycosyltransferase involved in cell wall biosynthesis